MPTPAPADRNFDDLVREGLALLPVYAPEWTNHNPSDPGVTLVELLAWLTDILLYRIGRVTPAAKLQFLRLLKGAAWPDSTNLAGKIAGKDLDALQRAIDAAVQELAQVDCAVTAADFERLALAALQRPVATERVVLVRCIVDADLSGDRQVSSDTARPGHVSVIVAPLDALCTDAAARLRARVRRYLLPRCLLTTRLHVVAPDSLYVGIGCGVALQAGVSFAAASRGIVEALAQRFGYDAQTGRAPALGAPLNLSAVARAIADVPGVDYVENVTVLQLTTEPHAAAHADGSLGVQIGVRSKLGEDARIGGALPFYEDRLLRDSGGALATVKLKPWECLRLTVAPGGIHEIGVAQQNAIESRGGRDE